MRISLPRGWVICWAVMLLAAPCFSESTEDESLVDLIPAILSSVKKLPRPIDFDVALPQLSDNSEYVIELARWGIPNDGSQPVTTTDTLQAAIDWASEQGFTRIVIPDGRYLLGKEGNAIYHAGIVLPSDLELQLSDGATLEMTNNNKWNYCVIAVTGKSDIIIRGGTIKGDRNTHIFTPRANDGATAHDEGHGICIQNQTRRVLVENMRIHSLTGDGLLLVTKIEDVTIRNNEIFNNRRQGVSVVGGTRIAIENNEIHHIRGTSPQFGIDIEGAGRKDKDILIRRNSFHHNRGGDIVNTSGENVFIVKNVLDQGTEGADHRYIDGPLVTWHRTDNVIAQNTITMYNGSVNGRLGFIQYSGGGDKGHSRLTYVHDNVCHGCGMYMYKSADADIRRNKFLGYFLALAEFDNATVIDNTVTTGPPGTPQYCWTYRIAKTTGMASGNTFNGRAANLALSSEPWTTQCLRR